MVHDHNKSSSSDSSWEKLAIRPNEYDVLLTDIDEAELKKLGKREEIENLSTGTFSSPAFPVEGVIHGLNMRLMSCLVCQRAEKPNAPIVNVWFLVDTGSPHTFLSEKTMESLFGPGNSPPDQVRLAIQDQNSVIECHTSHSHFAEANLLGMNALRKLELTIEKMHWKKDTFRLVNE